MGSQKIKVNLDITGMHCAACARTVEKTLAKGEGIDSVVVNFANNQAYIEGNSEELQFKDLVDSVESVGYGIKTDKGRYKVKGMHCASCVNRVESVVSKMPGVIEANVNLGLEEASISFVPGIMDLEQVRAAVIDSGYDIEPIVDEAESVKKKQ
jgi:Cu+-exporting ATPase